MIRVPIPIDLATIAATASGAFALATPLRVDRLLALAIAHSLGSRAPQDKRDRCIRTNLGAFVAGKFVVDIDGRLYDRPDSVVVCTGIATLRFFANEPGRRSLPAR
ncbi:MAG: hypothetical protein NVS2B8_11570 [Vulcanimicrobiaceae bacterium]